MSFAVTITAEPPVSDTLAATLATAFEKRVGEGLTGARGDSFMFIDNGDLSDDSDQGLFVPREPLSSGFAALINDLLKEATSVTFCAAWLGDKPESEQPVGAGAFAEQLSAGEIREDVLYRISR